MQPILNLEVFFGLKPLNFFCIKEQRAGFREVYTTAALTAFLIDHSEVGPLFLYIFLMMKENIWSINQTSQESLDVFLIINIDK